MVTEPPSLTCQMFLEDPNKGRHTEETLW